MENAYLCIPVLSSRVAFSPVFVCMFVSSCSCWIKKMPWDLFSVQAFTWFLPVSVWIFFWRRTRAHTRQTVCPASGKQHAEFLALMQSLQVSFEVLSKSASCASILEGLSSSDFPGVSSPPADDTQHNKPSISALQVYRHCCLIRQSLANSA